MTQNAAIRLVTTGMALACFGMVSSAVSAASPHPAVVRVVVQEAAGLAFGSGTLVDKRDQYGMVVTNWHVVSDATGKIEVGFPDGFRSEARAIKLDSTWDLAALVIWRPPVEVVALASQPPRPGEQLTICGYGQGAYRAASGICTDYYSPEPGLPQELVELNVEARQGDSGGPIFNERGELAGVLFGAGQGTTLGSYGPRVESFLVALAPNLAQPRRDVVTKQAEENAAWNTLVGPVSRSPELSDQPRRLPWSSEITTSASGPIRTKNEPVNQFAPWPETSTLSNVSDKGSIAKEKASVSANGGIDAVWYDAAKSVLAVIGLVALLLQLVRLVS